MRSRMAWRFIAPSPPIMWLPNVVAMASMARPPVAVTLREMASEADAQIAALFSGQKFVEADRFLAKITASEGWKTLNAQQQAAVRNSLAIIAANPGAALSNILFNCSWLNVFACPANCEICSKF